MDIKEFANFYNGIDIDDYIAKDITDIFHYTSPAGVKGILENTTLRFTDRNYLNDKTEGVYVLKLCIDEIDSFNIQSDSFKKCFLKECNERLKAPQRNRFFVYQCSFSLDSDSLCLWNYYTKSEGIKGYNLKFKTENISKGIIVQYNDKDRIPKLRYGKVIYEKSEQVSLLKKIIEKFYEYSQKDTVSGEQFICAYLVDKIMYLGTFFKMDCFSVENEFRLVYDLYLNDDNTYAVIKDEQRFYEKNGIFIPYVDLKFDEKILTGISISPTLDYEATRESLIRMVGKKFSNISSDSIVESKIPVRY